jgi:hypothetical protein
LFRKTLIWGVLLAGIWFAATATVRWRSVRVEGSGTQTVTRWGSTEISYQTRQVPIDDPQPPTRKEIVRRGTLGIALAVIGSLYLRAAAKRDREAANDLQSRAAGSV